GHDTRLAIQEYPVERLAPFLSELLVRLYALGGPQQIQTTATMKNSTAATAALNHCGGCSTWPLARVPLHRMLLLLGRDSRRLQRKAMAFSQCCFSSSRVQRQQQQHEQQQRDAVQLFPQQGTTAASKPSSP